MERKPPIVGIGELLWDLLPDGKYIGGAPANFACHARALGAEAYLVSAVGRDALGQEFLNQLREQGLATDHIEVLHHPTGTVTVELDQAGLPRYIIHEGVAWDYISYGMDQRDLAARAEAVCFGSLAQRSAVSRRSIRDFLAATRSDCLRIFDVNFRQHYFDLEVVETSLELANAVKLNDDELPMLAELLGYDATDPEFMQALLTKFNLDLLALTRGAKGCLLKTRREQVAHEGFRVSVVSTVGAGDAFTAALVMGWLRRDSLRNIAEQACRLAASVCTHPGALPVKS